VAHVFFDDSGKFGDSDFVCLAGYIADDAGWNKFCEKWGPLLLKHKIPYIHMRELIPLRGPYQDLGWDNPHRDNVLGEFIGIIREHVIAGFGVGVDSKYLRSMSKDARKAIGDPQMLSFQRLLRIVVKKLESVGYDAAVAPVFDDCEEYSVRCYRMWSRLKTHVPELAKYVASICFADEVTFRPLQAADIIV